MTMRRLHEASNEVLRVLEAVEAQERLRSETLARSLWAARGELKAALLAEGVDGEFHAHRWVDRSCGPEPPLNVCTICGATEFSYEDNHKRYEGWAAGGIVGPEGLPA